MQPAPLFHLAFPVHDLAEARRFYGGLLGCAEGRSSETWVDFNFYGHQLVAHLAPEETGHRSTSEVDVDFVLPQSIDTLADLAFEPDDEDLSFDFPIEDEEDEGDAGSMGR